MCRRALPVAAALLAAAAMACMHLPWRDGALDAERLADTTIGATTQADPTRYGFHPRARCSLAASSRGIVTSPNGSFVRDCIPNQSPPQNQSTCPRGKFVVLIGDSHVDMLAGRLMERISGAAGSSLVTPLVLAPRLESWTLVKRGSENPCKERAGYYVSPGV